MIHECVRCGARYNDFSNEILKGCKCGSRLFRFKKSDSPKGEKAQPLQVSAAQGVEEHSVTEIDSGKYAIDLEYLFNKRSIVTPVGDGAFSVDIGRAFKRPRKKKQKPTSK